MHKDDSDMDTGADSKPLNRSDTEELNDEFAAVLGLNDGDSNDAKAKPTSDYQKRCQERDIARNECKRLGNQVAEMQGSQNKMAEQIQALMLENGNLNQLVKASGQAAESIKQYQAVITDLQKQVERKFDGLQWCYDEKGETYTRKAQESWMMWQKAPPAFTEKIAVMLTTRLKNFTRDEQKARDHVLEWFAKWQFCKMDLDLFEKSYTTHKSGVAAKHKKDTSDLFVDTTRVLKEKADRKARKDAEAEKQRTGGGGANPFANWIYQPALPAAPMPQAQPMRQQSNITGSSDPNRKLAICKFHFSKSGCKKGDKCHFSHTKPMPVKEEPAVDPDEQAWAEFLGNVPQPAPAS